MKKALLGPALVMLLSPWELCAAEVGPARLFFAPTARALPRGRGSIGLTEIAFPWGEVGLSERFSLQGIALLPLEELTEGGIIVAPKIQLIRHARVQAALGTFQLLGPETGGVGYVVVTLGGAQTAATVGYGYGYGELADSVGSSSLVFVGAERAISRSLRLIVEGWVGGEALGLPERTLIGALRFGRGHWSVDLGVVVPVYETGSGTPFPLLTIARSF